MASEETLNDFYETGGFLGQGWSFPPTFIKGLNTVSLVKAEEDIKQSLNILFSTILGERVMRSDYGSNLYQQVFEPNEPAFRTMIMDLMNQAISKYETRITLDDISITTQDLEGRVDISVFYTVESTNTRSNIVYPYYLTEGTNVSQ